MMMLTKAIQNKLPKLYATDGVKMEDKSIVCKFFTPWSSWTWYVFEGEYNTEAKTWEFFGMVDNGRDDPEMGYFQLSELESIRGPFGLKIERDRHFKNKFGRDIK